METINTELNHLRMEENFASVHDQFTLSQPLVSVIVPAYNAEAYLAHALNSVLSQTYKNIEVIVVDDGSNDGTAQIVESIIQRDDRVILLRQPNSGVAVARNLAIEKSRGEYIAPIDADDIWYPQKIEKQVYCMLHAEPSTGLVYGWSVHIDKRGMLTGGYNAFNIEGDVFLSLIMCNFIGNGSVPLIRRACFDRVGGYKTQVEPCEDYDLQLRIAEFYKYRIVREFLVGYRKVISSRSFNYKAMETSRHIVIEDVKKKYPHILQCVIHWSWSHYYLYLSCQSKLRSHYWPSILYLYKAVRMSPVFLLYAEFYRFLYGCVLRLAKQVVVRVIRVVFCPSAWTGEKGGHAHRELTLSDIIIQSNRPPTGLSKLHRIRLKRIHRLFGRRKLRGEREFC